MRLEISVRRIRLPRHREVAAKDVTTGCQREQSAEEFDAGEEVAQAHWRLPATMKLPTCRLITNGVGSWKLEAGSGWLLQK